MSKWVETATAIGVSLDHNNKLKLTAPHGVKDLINLEVKMTPHFRGKVDLQEHYKKRVEEKKWQEKWPKLKVSYE